MSGGTKIFLAVFGLLLILLIVYYGFLGGVGPDQVSANGDVKDPLAAATEGNQTQPLNQQMLAQHENRPLFGDRTGENDGSSNATPQSRADRSNPFGLMPATGDDAADALLRSQNPAEANSVRDPLLPTPYAVNDPLNATGGTESIGNRPLVQPHEPRRPMTTAPGAAAETANAGSGVSSPRSNAAESVHYVMYTVQPNDTLSGIALDWFKDSTKWDLIVEANPGINPDFIRQGSKLRLPPKSAARTASTPSRTAAAPREASGPRSHTVRSGDTLSFISQQYYGTQNRWREIYNANRRVIGADPDALQTGDTLVIPQ